MKIKVLKIHECHKAAVLPMSWRTREISPSLPFWNIQHVIGSGISQPAGPSYHSRRAAALTCPLHPGL